MSACIFGDEITHSGFAIRKAIAVLCAPPPHSPLNDDLVHKLPPVNV